MKFQILFLISVLFVSSCKEKSVSEPETVPASAPKPLEAVVILTVGDVTYGGEKLKPGKRIGPGQILRTGKKSYADLQILPDGPDASIRVDENSEFSFEASPATSHPETRLHLPSGKAMFDVKKIKQTEEVKIYTPTTVVGVRGTKFTAVSEPSKSSRIELLEGSVAVKPRIREMETMPEELLETSKSLSSLQKELDSSEIILEKGQTVTLGSGEIDSFKKSSGLDEVLQSEEIHTLLSGGEVKKEDLEKLNSLLDEKLHTTPAEDKSAPPSAITLKKNDLPEKDLSTKLNQFNDLVRIDRKELEKSENTESLVKEFNQKRKKEIQKKIESIFDSETELLILKDGRKFEGVLIEEGNKILLLSPEGKMEFERNEVDSREAIGE